MATSDDEDDSLFDALENEDISNYRAQRIEELNSELASNPNGGSNHHQRASSSTLGALVNNAQLIPTLTTDQSLLDFTTKHERCVVHFSHPDFARCATMDKHLETLCGVHHETHFARADVRYVPFVVEKLKVKVLPCVIGFVDGAVVERVVGFEGLGERGTDADREFSSKVLEWRFLRRGVLVKGRVAQDEGGDAESEDEEDEREKERGIRSGNAARRGKDDEDDDDWD